MIEAVYLTGGNDYDAYPIRSARDFDVACRNRNTDE
jgi:hypothetical protein